MLKLYSEAIESMEKNPNIPPLFRNIFNNAYLPYRDPETLKLFLRTIGEFEYTHSEKLGDAFEYLLSVMGSQGDAGQFRTPRHIIDFIVAIVDPSKTDTILDPACGTAGFLISAFKHIKQKNKNELTPDERKKLIQNLVGYDISPDMVRLSLVNLYLHGFSEPHIYEYDTLSSEERWNENYDVILANPPFMSPKGGIRPHKKFTISSTRSEVLFVDYIAEHLNPKGKAGVIVPEGVIFQSGTAYRDLRKMLVDNYLYAVVSLPAGVFNPYSGVKTSILLMDKEVTKHRNEILFVKIDNDGFNLGAQRTVIKGGQLEEAIELTHEFVQTGELKGTSLAHAVPKIEIAKSEDYNLSGERYKLGIELSSPCYDIADLGDLVEVLDNRRKPITKSDRTKGEYPYYGATGILDYIDDFIFSEKLVLVGEDGAKWLSGDKTAFIAKGKYWVNNHAHVLRPKREIILDNFLVEMLNYMDLSPFITGVTVPKLNQAKLKSIQIPLPPLSIQEEIVDEIEGYQKIIDGAKAVVDNYKPKIDIDPEWEMVELGESIDFISGLTLSIPKNEDPNGVPIISMNSIKESGELVEEGIRRIKLPNKKTIHFLKKGDLLFNWRNGSKHLVGKTAIFDWEENSYVFASFLLGIRPHSDKYKPKFLWYLFNQYRLEGLYEQFMRQNVNGLFNREELKILKMPVVPINLQEQIIEELDNQRTLVKANKQLIEIFEQKIKDRITKVWGD